MENNDLKLIQTLGGLILVYIFVSITRFSLRSLRPKNFPPGPSALPFVGNAHHFASLKPFLKFTEWHTTYGDVVGLKAGPSNIVVLNSPEACHELLEKRGALYSERPYGYVEREHILRGSQHLLFVSADRYYKQCRTAIRAILGAAGVNERAPLHNAAAAFLMKSFATSPEESEAHLFNWAIGVPLNGISGHRGAQKDKKLIKDFFTYLQAWVELLTPGLAPPVDMIPLLKYLPASLAGWKREARILRRNQRAWYYMMLDTAKERLKSGSVNERGDSGSLEPLIVTLLRQQKEEGSFEDDQIAYLCGTVFDAAVETSHSSALTFIKILAAYPHILQKVQAEIDTICGGTKPPGPEDIARLPYLKACWFEVLRWRPANAIFPRTVDRDDTFRGWHIPKGTIIIQNTWGISHDPNLYSSPSTFDPERYLQSPYGSTESIEKSQARGRKTSYVFGAGRRVCPGDLWAQSTFMIMAAKLVWAFDVVAKGELDFSIETGYSGGLVLGPTEFGVELKPRSELRRQAIIDESEATRTWLD